MSVQSLSENIANLTLDDLNELYQEEIDNFGLDMQLHMTELRELTESLITNMELYQARVKTLNLTKVSDQARKFMQQKELIYEDFFKLQNLINSFINQKIIMTYVSVDPISGQREVRLFDNDISHLAVTTQSTAFGSNYAKLTYDVSHHYSTLKNSLSDDENLGLQSTAAEVEARYVKYKHRILWKINNEWYGYRLTNRGPINEAFVDFYLHEVQLNQSLPENIHTFMKSEVPKGVIQADNANGFLMGDTSIGGLHFAVKGNLSGPQNFTMIINWLKKLRDSDFSEGALQTFITRFKDEERQRATSLVKPLLTKSIAGMVQYHGDNLLKRWSKFDKL